MNEAHRKSWFCIEIRNQKLKKSVSRKLIFSETDVFGCAKFVAVVKNHDFQLMIDCTLLTCNLSIPKFDFGFEKH